MARQTRLTRERRSGKSQRGFTLLEIMIVLAVAMILFGMVGSTVINTIRVSEQEKTLLEMDTNAAQTLNGMSAILRAGVAPITTGSSDTSGFQGVMNDKARGFGKNGKAWASLLQKGTDCLAFTVPVDADGDGDRLDADFLPELGIENVLGQVVPGGTYTGAGKLAGNVNASLAEIDPGDFGLNAGATDIDLTAMRFADDFEFPTGAADPAYGVIRFVPVKDGGDYIILDESQMNRDLNENGDTDDKFVLGSIVACYPGRADPYKSDRRYLSKASVLLQLNRDGDGWEPLFRLSRYKEGDASENMDTIGGKPAAGDFTLHVKLLLCDNIGQRNPTAFNRILPFLARKYDRVIVLRNMAIR